jgi:hypothetical protein
MKKFEKQLVWKGLPDLLKWITTHVRVSSPDAWERSIISPNERDTRNSQDEKVLLTFSQFTFNSTL